MVNKDDVEVHKYKQYDMYDPAMNQVYNHKQLITYMNIEFLNNRKTLCVKGNTNTHICNEKLASETQTFIRIMT